MTDIFSILQDDISFRAEGNIIHFILKDGERPWWSVMLDKSYIQQSQVLNMQKNYELQKSIMTADPARKRFVEFVSRQPGVKVDLASGPSGYFSAVLDNLAKTDLFIATDACPTVVSAHSMACDKENFYVFDMDLEKKLPFKDASVDVFSGNLLDNIMNYADLVREAYRCLKSGGCLSLIEMFFNYGCKTYEHLISKGEIWASFETFVAFCERVGFLYMGGDVISSQKGKLDIGDLYPLDENDGWTTRTLYFVKKENFHDTERLHRFPH